VLNKLGYLSDTPTGYFGVNTENAVKAFQREKGIASSGNWYSTGYGMVGAKTRSALLKAVAQ
jgi:peptidoglycan hydrolase-like protein with peptidoglycan-binding domain